MNEYEQLRKSEIESKKFKVSRLHERLTRLHYAEIQAKAMLAGIPDPRETIQELREVNFFRDAHEKALAALVEVMPDPLFAELYRLQDEIAELEAELKSLESDIDICEAFAKNVGFEFYDWFVQNVAQWINSKTTYREIPSVFVSYGRYREAAPAPVDFAIEPSEISPIFDYDTIDFEFKEYSDGERGYRVAVNEKYNAVRMIE